MAGVRPCSSRIGSLPTNLPPHRAGNFSLESGNAYLLPGGFAMKIRVSPAAAFVLATIPMMAQQQGDRVGVSNPDPVTIDANNQETAAPSPAAESQRRPINSPKPSAAKPERTGEVYGAYVPYKGPAA